MNTYTSKQALIAAVKEQITSRDKQAINAMLRIYEYQTESEQQYGRVSDDNGVGFAGTDAEILTSFCNQYKKYGRLSEKQMVIIRKKIGKYAGQLVKHAISNGIYVKEGKVWVIVKK